MAKAKGVRTEAAVVRAAMHSLNEEVLMLLDKSPALAGYIKKDCLCATCSINREFRTASIRIGNARHAAAVRGKRGR